MLKPFARGTHAQTDTFLLVWIKIFRGKISDNIYRRLQILHVFELRGRGLLAQFRPLSSDDLRR